MQSPQPMQNILYHEYLSIKISKSKEISFSQRLSYNVLLTTCLSQRLSHNVFLKNVVLTTYLSQRFSDTVALTYSSTQRSPHSDTIYAKFFRVVPISKNISNLSKSDPRNFDNFGFIKLKPRRCTSAIYILSLYCFRTLRQRLHIKMQRTKCCMNIP